MRFWVLGLALVGLAACDSGQVPSPAERMNNPDAAIAADVDTTRIIMRSDGLNVGAERFFFAAGQREVETALEGMLGEAETSGTMEECGAGPMDFATYPGGLTVNFQQGALVGWWVKGGADIISFAGDAAIGTSREELEASGGFAMIEGSTLGEEFTIGNGLAGFFEEGTVSMMYAGTQCFFR